MEFIKVNGEYYQKGDVVEYKCCIHKDEIRTAKIHSFCWNEERGSHQWPLLLILLDNGDEIKPHQLRQRLYKTD